MRATTWQAAVRGIEPWKGAQVRHVFGGELAIVVGRDARGWWCSDGPDYPDDTDRLFLFDAEWYIDLADPDTCAAFDRRLALRLGATEAQVKQGGFGVWYDADTFCVYAGARTQASECTSEIGWTTFIAWEWMMSPDDDEKDPLLGRALAWTLFPRELK